MVQRTIFVLQRFRLEFYSYSIIQILILMEKFTHDHELSQKTVNIILVIGVLIYLAFILYREMNGLG